MFSIFSSEAGAVWGLSKLRLVLSTQRYILIPGWCNSYNSNSIVLLWISIALFSKPFNLWYLMILNVNVLKSLLFFVWLRVICMSDRNNGLGLLTRHSRADAYVLLEYSQFVTDWSLTLRCPWSWEKIVKSVLTATKRKKLKKLLGRTSCFFLNNRKRNYWVI